MRKDELLEKSLKEIHDLVATAGRDFLKGMDESQISGITQFQLTAVIMRSAYDYLIREQTLCELGKQVYELRRRKK